MYVVVRVYEGLGVINRASKVFVVGRAQVTRTIVAMKWTMANSFAVLATPANGVVPHDEHEEAGHARPHTEYHMAAWNRSTSASKPVSDRRRPPSKHPDTATSEQPQWRAREASLHTLGASRCGDAQVPGRRTPPGETQVAHCDVVNYEVWLRWPVREDTDALRGKKRPHPAERR